MSLKKYQSKRNFQESPEPSAKMRSRKQSGLSFVIQKHAARRLHYDLRLEVNGVLVSWAIPKGPSLNPKDKRLAINVEDHPYDYKDFEGVIPKGYGAGTVMIWDRGTYHSDHESAKETEKEIASGIKKGEIHFFLEGEKLKGEFILIRLKNSVEWLLIKKKDAYASIEDITLKDRSVVSQASIEEISQGKPGKKTVTWNKGIKKKMPHHLIPMMATLIDEPFDHENWFFEIKWDGFRALAEIKNTEVEIYSRNQQPFNQLFPAIVEHLKQYKIEALFDGEIVVLDKKGIPNFQLLQNMRRSKEKDQTPHYFVFDILYYRGYDLRGLPLFERKELLKSILSTHENSLIHYCDHIETTGKQFFKVCTEKNLEGIIGKQKLSQYRDGVRGKDWVKIKRLLRQEVIICGFTEPKGGRKNIGSLILGIYEGKRLKFIGHCGGGFTQEKLKEVKQLLSPLIQKECPFSSKPKTNTPVTWVKPYYLCEVSFSEWTLEGIMRQPIFIGLREDKSPKAVVKEIPKKKKEIIGEKTTQNSNGKENIVTHPDKLYWPREGIAKKDVVDYYVSVAQYILPHLKDRPQSLKRFPNGIEAPSFFQKNLVHHPSWIKTIDVNHDGKIVHYLLIQDIESLIYAVNLGCIELHPFFSRTFSLDYPDFLVFDLDPEDISFDTVIEVAQFLHQVLEEFKIPSYCKTSGARGLHVCVPLQAKYAYEQVKQFAQVLAIFTHQRISQITSLERSPKKRQKKVYIDFLQNGLGKTIASAYSLRAKPGAPVSTPLEWSEVKKGIHPLDFNLHNLEERLKKKGDLFLPVLGKGISIEKALKKIEFNIT